MGQSSPTPSRVRTAEVRRKKPWPLGTVVDARPADRIEHDRPHVRVGDLERVIGGQPALVRVVGPLLLDQQLPLGIVSRVVGRADPIPLLQADDPESPRRERVGHDTAGRPRSDDDDIHDLVLLTSHVASPSNVLSAWSWPASSASCQAAAPPGDLLGAAFGGGRVVMLSRGETGAGFVLAIDKWREHEFPAIRIAVCHCAGSDPIGMRFDGLHAGLPEPGGSPFLRAGITEIQAYLLVAVDRHRPVGLDKLERERGAGHTEDHTVAAVASIECLVHGQPDQVTVEVDGLPEVVVMAGKADRLEPCETFWPHSRGAIGRVCAVIDVLWTHGNLPFAPGVGRHFRAAGAVQPARMRDW